MAGEVKDQKFPAPCPACGEKAATPFDTKGTKAEITLFIRCRRCLNIWQMTFTRPPLFLKPKADRRAP